MTTKIIAIDAMGGDHAPQAVVEGVNRALADFPDLHVELYGKQEQILQYLTTQERVTIVHTDEKIASDDDPMVAVRRKKGSSMMLAIRSVKDGRAQAVVSAGNTGALLLAGTTVVKTIKGVERPGLLSTLPTMDGRGVDMLDLGANPESKPENLRQYAILGAFHAQKVRGITNPRVGLLNNGTETIKGDPLRRDTYQLLSEDKTINFIGNVESRDLLNGVCDVVVTDGFTGNAVLKAIEGTAKAMKDQLSSAIKTGNLFAQIGGFLIRPTLTKKLSSLDYRKSGGAVLFGLRAPVIKAHGSSDAEAIYHTIKQALAIVSSGVVEASAEAFGDR